MSALRITRMSRTMPRARGARRAHGSQSARGTRGTWTARGVRTTARGFVLAACAFGVSALATIFAGTASAQSRQRVQTQAGKLAELDAVRLPAGMDPGLPYAAPELKLFEVELGGGVTFAPVWRGAGARPGGSFFAELRLNRPEPWDVGLQFRGANFSHTVGGVKVGTMTINPMLFVDYNLRTWRSTILFGGVGVGGCFAYNDAVVMTSPQSGVWLSGEESLPAVTPRVGANLGGWMRVTAEYAITARRYSRLSLSFGIVIGGTHRRSRADRRADHLKLWDDVAAPIIIDQLVRPRRRR